MPNLKAAREYLPIGDGPSIEPRPQASGPRQNQRASALIAAATIRFTSRDAANWVGRASGHMRRYSRNAASHYLVFGGCFFGVAADAPAFGGGCGVGAARSRSVIAVRIASTCFWMSARARS
jgi:hypothetical protein